MSNNSPHKEKGKNENPIGGYTTFLNECVSQTENRFLTARLQGRGFPIKGYFSDTPVVHGDEALHQIEYVLEDRKPLKGGFVADLSEIPSGAEEILCKELYSRIKDWSVFNPERGFAGILRRGSKLEIYESK